MWQIGGKICGKMMVTFAVIYKRLQASIKLFGSICNSLQMRIRLSKLIPVTVFHQQIVPETIGYVHRVGALLTFR